MLKREPTPNAQVHTGILFGFVGAITTLAATIISVSPDHISQIMMGDFLLKDWLWVGGIGGIALCIALLCEPTRCFLEERASNKRRLAPTFMEMLEGTLKHNAIPACTTVAIGVYFNTGILLPYLQNFYSPIQATWIATVSCMGMAVIATAIVSAAQCLYLKYNGEKARYGGTTHRIYHAQINNIAQFCCISTIGAAVTTGLCSVIAPFMMQNCCNNADFSMAAGILVTISIALISGVATRYIRDQALPITPQPLSS